MITPTMVSILTVFSVFIPKVVSLSNEIAYIGCVDAPLTTYYSHVTVVKPLLSWEMCAKLCTNQVTVYMGIDVNNSTCLCGDDIAQLSTATEETECNSCHDDATKYCGGSGTMSLYQLRAKNQNPLIVLLATNQGIKICQDLSSPLGIDQEYTIEVPKSVSSGATSVAYHFSKQEVYYVSSNKIFKSTYEPVMMKYYHPTLVVETNCSSVVDLAVDWVHDRIYWGCSTTRKIYSANLDGFSIQEPVVNAYDLQHIEVEPFVASVIFIEQRKLGSYDFITVTRDVFYNYKFQETLQIAIDIQQETIYAIGSYTIGGSKKYLVSTNYSGTVFKIVYTGPELLNPFGLDAFNGTLIWGNKNNTDYTIYKGLLSPKCELENMRIIHSGRNVIKDVKIYGPEVQTPGKHYLCKKKNCSHSCSMVTPSLVLCTCPESMFLSSNQRTCMISSVTTSDPTEVSMLEAMYISAKPDSSEIVITVSQTSESNEFDTVVPTKASLKPRLDGYISHQRWFYTTIFVCLVTFVAIALFQVYMCLMMKKSNENIIFQYSNRPENNDSIYSEPGRGSCNLYS